MKIEQIKMEEMEETPIDLLRSQLINPCVKYGINIFKEDSEMFNEVQTKIVKYKSNKMNQITKTALENLSIFMPIPNGLSVEGQLSCTPKIGDQLGNPSIDFFTAVRSLKELVLYLCGFDDYELLSIIQDFETKQEVEYGEQLVFDTAETILKCRNEEYVEGNDLNHFIFETLEFIQYRYEKNI